MMNDLSEQRMGWNSRSSWTRTDTGKLKNDPTVSRVTGSKTVLLCVNSAENKFFSI